MLQTFRVERDRRRRPAAGLIVAFLLAPLALLATPGCGGPPDSPRALVDAFLAAYQSGDYATMTGLLSDGSQEALRSADGSIDDFFPPLDAVEEAVDSAIAEAGSSIVAGLADAPLHERISWALSSNADIEIAGEPARLRWALMFSVPANKIGTYTEADPLGGTDSGKAYRITFAVGGASETATAVPGPGGGLLLSISFR